MARLGKEQSGHMTAEIGARLRARRERIGWDVKRLAAEAGVHRTTLAALESGEGFRGTTRAKVEKALDEAEEAMGITDAPPAAEPASSDLIEFEITGDPGMRIVVRGPIADHETLVGDVARLIREIRANPDNSGSAAHGTDE